jgi:hypothetical protein
VVGVLGERLGVRSELHGYAVVDGVLKVVARDGGVAGPSVLHRGRGRASSMVELLEAVV